MPKYSEKRKLITTLKESALFDLMMAEIFASSDDIKTKEDEIIDNLILSLEVIEHYRYAVPFVLGSVPKSEMFLVHILPILDENRFKELVRVNRKNFNVILNLIKDDESFKGRWSSKQIPLDMQLMIVLYRLGSCGEGASITKIACFFGVGDGGTIQVLTERIFRAILKLKCKYLRWPSFEERQQLVSETYHELPHCLGYVDGTEIKFAEKPSQDPEAYFSRKHHYSMKVQAVCDHKLLIRHMVLGYPGSVHDSRIYNNCVLSINAPNFFEGEEWIVGDSAYKLTSTVITPFRANSRSGTLKERNEFNKRLSKYRIRIEHCFGMLKERFNSLKELKIQIKNDECMKSACRWVLVCAILHNIIIEQREPLDSFEWIDDSAPDEVNITVDSSINNSTIEGELKRQAILEIMKE